ncbi:zinc-binding dehydrogenase [Paraburkholderia tropica]|uniref:zinc-binding dehydrogenase n=1 Tax=Paraburkholderia tropica TaxID=92647 RepID=UPI001CC78BDB
MNIGSTASPVAGAFEPVVDSTFPLSRAADAHRSMESSANVGKIILNTNQAGPRRHSGHARTTSDSTW